MKGIVQIGVRLGVMMVWVILFLVPIFTFAQEGLVPSCPVGDVSCTEAYHPDNYGICELVALSNNILRFVIGLLALVATVALVYRGYQLVVSQGNPSVLAKTKDLIVSLLIGVTIMLSAFLIVNTVMGILVGRDNPILNWNNFSCTYANSTATPSRELPEIKEHPNGILTMEEITYVVQTYGINISSYSSAAACDMAAIQQVWGSLASQASCIISKESACGATPISKTDIGADKNPFSFGAMQINTTVHVVQGCQSLGIQNLDCKSAWSGRNYDARVINASLYQQCANALLNNTCNMINGKRIYQEAGNSWRPWSTAKSCGLI